MTMAGIDAPTDGDSPDRTRRAVLALAAWTAVVAVPGLALAGTVSFWGAHDHLARGSSGPAAVLASDALTLFLTTVLGAAVALPLLVVRTRLRQSGRSTVATLLGTAAGLVAPVALVGVWALFAGITIAGAVFFASGAAVAVLTLGGVAGFVIEARAGSEGGRDAGSDDALPWLACCWNYWLAGALVVGAVGGGIVGAPLGGAVETWSGTPQAAFDYGTTETADGTRLTITHDGGDELPAAGLRVTGNLTAVPGANQTRAGPWNGSTTHIERAFRPGPHVAPGDTVAVGVPEDCVVRVVYRRGGDAATLDKYDCLG